MGIDRPLNINGRLAFWARQGTKEFIVNEEGEKTDREYDEIYFLKPHPDGEAYVIARQSDLYVKEIVRKEFFTYGI